ncbi:hypothetical protein, partial [Burkholderia gladioli]|uniref:hypothetical protein n=1 Tax=Burkholderia gladioli TaxID=28095 RepID=UPI001ABA9E55
VIVPVAFMASAPQAMLAASLNPQTRHFNLAETRHLNLGLTHKLSLIMIMSNNGLPTKPILGCRPMS